MAAFCNITTTQPRPLLLSPLPLLIMLVLPLEMGGERGLLFRPRQRQQILQCFRPFTLFTLRHLPPQPLPLPQGQGQGQEWEWMASTVRACPVPRPRPLTLTLTLTLPSLLLLLLLGAKTEAKAKAKASCRCGGRLR